MTVTTVEAPTSLADVHGLEQSTAIKVAAYLQQIGDVAVRREYAAAAMQARRDELALYRQLYRERYGVTLPVAQHEAGDVLLVELTTLAVA